MFRPPMSIPMIETAPWVDRLVRRHPRTLRVLAGLLVMAALFAVLLSAAGPSYARMPAAAGISSRIVAVDGASAVTTPVPTQPRRH